MKTLIILWEQLRNITIDENECIEQSFTVTDRVFPIGTHRETIWHWFDEKCPNNLHDDLMYPKNCTCFSEENVKTFDGTNPFICPKHGTMI